MKSLAVSADHLRKISPEGAAIANTFLEMQCDIKKTSEVLDIPGHEVNKVISSRPVQTYLVQVMTDSSLRSMDKITASMEDIIETKMHEMRELDMTSAKDIADLLQMAHRMQTEKAKVVQSKLPKENKLGNALNQQNNFFSADENSQYARLMKAIIEG